MLKKREANQRGRGQHGWLDSFHSFSFADYYDPEYMGFRALRVINEDYIAPSRGFPTHPHQNMEIITVVVGGAIEHKDTMGNEGIIRPGEVQYMSAGTGVRHSEYNALDSETTHILQIWILPSQSQLGAAPRYDQRDFTEQLKNQRLTLAASPDGRESSIAIRQDASLYLGSFAEQGGEVRYPIAAGRHVWIQLIEGELEVEGISLGPGDGLAVSDQSEIKMTARHPARYLLFDLA